MTTIDRKTTLKMLFACRLAYRIRRKYKFIKGNDYSMFLRVIRNYDNHK